MEKAYIIMLQRIMWLFTVLVTICLGTSSHELLASVAPHPERIVSLGPIYTENLYLLGVGDRIVGNTRYCVRPEAAKNKPKVGTVMEASVEKIIGLRPDLVVASGLTPPALVKQLRASGLRVVKYEQPRSLEDSCSQFLEMGKLLGLEVHARKIVDNVWKDVETLREKIRDLPSPRVLLQIGSQPLFAAVPGSFTNDFIKLTNGENVVGDQANGVFNREKVISRNPDVIFIAIMGSEAGIAGREKRQWLRFSTINAVRDKRIYIVDPDVSCSPSPATFVSTLKSIASQMYPGVVSTPTN